MTQSTEQNVALGAAPEARDPYEPLKLFVQLFRSPERKRLRATIGALRLGARGGLQLETGVGATFLELLEKADAEARAGDLDGGWKYFHEANRLWLTALPMANVEASIKTLATEAAAKLPSWRRAAIKDLLSGLSDKSSDEQRRAVLREALFVRDEHSNNVYFRNRLLRRQMAIAGGSLLALCAAFFGLLRLVVGPGEDLSASRLLTPETLGLCMILGGMGACLSALITFASSSTEQKIPEHLANVFVTFSRPLIGAVSGLVAALLLASGAIDFGKVALLTPFAFGFSERLVVGALKGGQTNGKT